MPKKTNPLQGFHSTHLFVDQQLSGIVSNYTNTHFAYLLVDTCGIDEILNSNTLSVDQAQHIWAQAFKRISFVHVQCTWIYLINNNNRFTRQIASKLVPFKSSTTRMRENKIWTAYKLYKFNEALLLAEY